MLHFGHGSNTCAEARLMPSSDARLMTSSRFWALALRAFSMLALRASICAGVRIPPDFLPPNRPRAWAALFLGIGASEHSGNLLAFGIKALIGSVQCIETTVAMCFQFHSGRQIADNRELISLKLL